MGIPVKIVTPDQDRAAQHTMTTSTASEMPNDVIPPLYQDRAFWGITSTQFLGAFNDSVFKQIVLLLCVTVVISSDTKAEDQQPLAQGIFALAFILFSGIAGYWSDRVGKRGIIVGCKLGEVLVMLLAVVAFAVMVAPVVIFIKQETVGGPIMTPVFEIIGTPWMLLGVLFLMGTQSAAFGPAKYGILPEMVRGNDLPRMNGIVQMTTFLALIFGTWVGGILLDNFNQSLSKAGWICVGIAVLGTWTSLLVRRTPVAQPEATFHWSTVAIAPSTRRLLREDTPLRQALLVYSVFWFVAAIFPMMVNWLGQEQFHLSYADTSFLLSSVSVGIAAGFVLAGKISAGCVNFGLVRIGTAGLALTLLLLSLPSGQATATPSGEILASASNDWHHLLGPLGSQIMLVFSGFFAGLLALPVQVFLQSRPPQEMKGRVIGTMNLVNWIAIIIAAVVFYPLASALLAALGLPKFGIFGLTGLLLLPIAFFYRTDKVVLSTPPETLTE